MPLDHDDATSLNIHRVTPLDIHNKEFRKSFRGYAEDEVDEFLDLVVAEMERIIRLNGDLQASISGLESRLEHYRGLEETLKNAIILAQKAADEIRESATKEAAVIKNEALLEAKRLKDEAGQAVEESYRQVDKNKNRLRRFNAEMKAFLQSTLELLSKGAEDIESGMEENS